MNPSNNTQEQIVEELRILSEEQAKAALGYVLYCLRNDHAFTESELVTVSEDKYIQEQFAKDVPHENLRDWEVRLYWRTSGLQLETCNSVAELIDTLYKLDVLDDINTDMIRNLDNKSIMTHIEKLWHVWNIYGSTMGWIEEYGIRPDNLQEQIQEYFNKWRRIMPSEKDAKAVFNNLDTETQNGLIDGFANGQSDVELFILQALGGNKGAISALLDTAFQAGIDVGEDECDIHSYGGPVIE